MKSLHIPSLTELARPLIDEVLQRPFSHRAYNYYTTSFWTGGSNLVYDICVLCLSCLQFQGRKNLFKGYIRHPRPITPTIIIIYQSYMTR